MGLLTEKQMKDMGLRFGKGVRISDKASIYGANKITIGDNVRIDDFTVLSAGEGGIHIGSHIHIAVFTSLIGKGSILIEDFVNFSSKVSIYSSNDDYSGNTLTSPLVYDHYKETFDAPVTLGKHTILGCGCVVLPGTTISQSCSIGALSLIPAKSYLEPFSVYAGIPAKYIKQRSRGHLELEKEFLEEYKNK